jgi:hypothetical protein
VGEAERVLSSSLTAVECARALARGRALGRLLSRDELAALRLLDVAAAGWDVHELSDRVLSRARISFPVQPVRTLAALHLATASLFLEALGQVGLLSFDERIRANLGPLGFEDALGSAGRPSAAKATAEVRRSPETDLIRAHG